MSARAQPFVDVKIDEEEEGKKRDNRGEERRGAAAGIGA